MFRRVFLQLPTKAEKLHKEHNGSGETLSVYTIQRETANEVINNDTELLINKFAGKHGRNTHLFLIRCSCTYSYSISHNVSAA